MEKCPRRLHLAIHTFEMLKGDDKIHPTRQGPIAGLMQAARILGGTLSTDQSGFLIDFEEVIPNLRISGGRNSHWKHNLRRAVTSALTRQLHSRTKEETCTDDTCDQGQHQLSQIPHPQEGDEDRPQPKEEEQLPEKEKKKGKRKDLQGVGTLIDVFATTALIKNKATNVLRKQKQLLCDTDIEDEAQKIASDPIHNQRVQSIIAGCPRAPDRLFEAGLADSRECKHCGKEDAGLIHTIWQCPAWKEIRDPYVGAINDYIDKNSPTEDDRKQHAAELLSTPCVMHCGVLPESDYFIKGGPPLPQKSPKQDQPNAALETLEAWQQRTITRDTEGRVEAFTDGTACCPEDWRRRRAAWAVYYAPEHSWNCAGPVTGEAQTVYRAELEAVHHVIASANLPTHIISDCKSIVEQCRILLHREGGEQNQPEGDHADLWKNIHERIREKPQGFFEVSRISSHLDVEAAQRIEDSGGFLARHIWGNDHADSMAKHAITYHDINWNEYDKAEDRSFLACTIQALIKKVWDKYFVEDTNANHAEDYEGVAEPNDAELVQEEVPPETTDEWAAEEEAAQWLQGQTTPRGNDACRGNEGSNECKTNYPLEDSDKDNEEDIWQSNRQLLDQLKQEVPGYPWYNTEQNSNEDLDLIHVPSPPEGIAYKKRGTFYVKGRGNVNVSLIHPQIYLEPVRKWFNSLMWIKRDADQLNSPNKTATLLECVVDFEMTSGIRLEDCEGARLSWGQKAKRIGYYLRTLARINTISWNGIPMSYNQAMKPTTDATSLTPVGGPLQTGFARRPIWADDRTPKIAAINLWRAKLQQSSSQKTAALKQRRNRKLTDEWYLTLKGYKRKKRGAVLDILDEVGLRAKASPGVFAAAERVDLDENNDDLQIDPHIPLPTVTREEKCRSCTATCHEESRIHKTRMKQSAKPVKN